MTRIAAIILAAGASHRYGAEDKLLADLAGKPVLAHVLETAAALKLSRKIVVVDPRAPRIAALSEQFDVEIVENTRAADGMGGSIAAGAKHLDHIDAAIITLGDMPFVAASTFRALISAFQLAPDKTICAPVFRERQGHPVLFGKSHFQQLATLDGDKGARRIINAHQDALLSVPVNDQGIVADIDRPSDLDGR